jgi:hypothetical protein
MHNYIVKVIKHFSGAMILEPRDGTDAAEYFGKN